MTETHQFGGETFIRLIDSFGKFLPVFICWMFIVRHRRHPLPNGRRLYRLHGLLQFLSINFGIIAFQLFQMLNAHLHQFLTTAMALDVGGENHHQHHQQSHT